MTGSRYAKYVGRGASSRVKAAGDPNCKPSVNRTLPTLTRCQLIDLRPCWSILHRPRWSRCRFPAKARQKPPETVSDDGPKNASTVLLRLRGSSCCSLFDPRSNPAAQSAVAATNAVTLPTCGETVPWSVSRNVRIRFRRSTTSLGPRRLQKRRFFRSARFRRRRALREGRRCVQRSARSQ